MWKLVNNNWKYLTIDEEPKKEIKSSIDIIEDDVKPKKVAKRSKAKVKVV